MVDDMTDEFLKVWFDYLSRRNAYIDKLKFTDQQTKFILVLWARINSLCDETITLVRNQCFVSPQILMRSALESFVDLRCLIADKDYIIQIIAAEADSDYKLHTNHSTSNPYYKGLEPITAEDLNSLKNAKSECLNIFDKFKKADCEDWYRTIYNNLCRYTHGNITALASKNFENDRVVIQPNIKKSDLLFVLSSTINLEISATHAVLEFFDTSADELSKFIDLINEVKVLCKKFV